jgi:hypothetical protein
MSDDDLSCIDGPDGCAGPVEWRTTPDRRDGRAFTRCDAHFELRLGEVERNLELTSDVAPRGSIRPTPVRAGMRTRDADQPNGPLRATRLEWQSRH